MPRVLWACFVWPVILTICIVSGISGCMVGDDCPSGWLMNATGDCIDPANLDPADGDDPLLNPCPPGWGMNAAGYCVQLVDGDDGLIPSDGDVPSDGDTIPQDGDRDRVDGDAASNQPPPCLDDGDCPFGTLCSPVGDQGMCLLKCTKDWECETYIGDSYCNADQRCLPGDQPSFCSNDSECAYGKLCHSEVASGVCLTPCGSNDDCSPYDTSEIFYFCNSQGRCLPMNDDPCSLDEQCPLNQVCHQELLNGTCMEVCFADYQCTNAAPDGGLRCNSLGKCYPIEEDSGCVDDEECLIQTVCHPDMESGDGLCQAMCIVDTECPEEGEAPGVYCNASGRCAVPNQDYGCDEDDDCRWEQVCHEEASDIGLCAAACTNSAFCNTISPGTGCNAEMRCVPGIVDGDVDGDEDGDLDVDLDPDPEIDDVIPTCDQLRQGSIYTLDIPSVTVGIEVKDGSAPYFDPSGKSSVYLRDTQTGSMFRIHENFSDGGQLPDVEVLAGVYDISVVNRYSQRKTVLSRVDLTSNRGVVLSVASHTITLHLRKNGQPFPLLSAGYRGSLTLYDRSTRMNHVIAEVGGGLNDFSVEVFDASYDILFDGYLAADDNARQRAKLLSNDPVTQDKEYTFNLETVRLQGAVMINGETPPADAEGRGEVWLINSLSGSRFPFWPMGTTGTVTFDREVISDLYFVAFAGPGENGDSYLWRNETVRSFTEELDDLIVDIPRVRFQGEVRRGEDPLYDHENLSRGEVYMINESTNERFLLADLGLSGSVAFDREIGPGTYSYRFEGALIDDPYFINRSYPYSEHWITFETGVSITADTNRDIELPVESVELDFTKNGSPVVLTNNGDYLKVRRENDSRDVVMVHFGQFEESSYPTTFQTWLFPSTYEMRYSGSYLFNGFQEFYLTQDFTVGANGTSQAINLSSHIIEVEITADDKTRLLTDLINDGQFDAAELQVYDEVIRNRTVGATNLNEQSRFTMERPSGTYSILIRLTSGDTYAEYPIFKEIEIDSDVNLTYDLNLVSYNLQVFKDGLPLPDSTSGYSRGDIVFRKSDDYRVVVSYDLLEEGGVNGLVPMLPGEYSVNLSTGFGTVFPHIQWVYLGCMELQ